ncbi:killer cell lectin-like receptor subfamily G member 1 [Puntigrus tetrazona]|uniref:killer cell lectin-like receptor subfamily G member 1 n=1 Tax=Puntigrus tetrazona TaxID=1606681 RepID=UPI001C8AD304|nr:killer cell lectin-like receptor subfamily G member 1 [Puntigrus tetrazona]
MAKHNMSDHIYGNFNFMKKDSFGIKKSAREKRCRPVCAKALLLLFILSLLVNGWLVYLCATKYNMLLHCEPVTNCSNSDDEQVIPGCTYDEDWSSLNYCPDLPEHWYKGNSRFYVFTNNNKTWSSSREYCKSLGGDLAFINSTEEKEFLAQRLCVTGESDLYWAGNEDTNWTNLDSKQHNCAALKGSTQETISCSREERSICEIPCLQ